MNPCTDRAATTVADWMATLTEEEIGEHRLHPGAAKKAWRQWSNARHREAIQTLVPRADFEAAFLDRAAPAQGHPRPPTQEEAKERLRRSLAREGG